MNIIIRMFQATIILIVVLLVFLLSSYAVGYVYALVFPKSMVAKVIINVPKGEHYIAREQRHQLYKDKEEGGEDFPQHQKNVYDYLNKNSVAMEEFSSSELANLNQPFYIESMEVPARANTLMLHGLYASPYSMRDMAILLAEQGVSSRLLLMPGHGTRPGDLIGIDSEFIYDEIDKRMREFIRNTGSTKRFLIGHSYGGLLLSLMAQRYPNDIDGVILFAPAFHFSGGLQTLANMTSNVLHYLPNDDLGTLAPVFYKSQALDPVVSLFKHLSLLKRQVKINGKMSVPTLLYISEHDEVTTYRGVIKTAKSLFNNLNLVLHTNDIARLKRSYGNSARYLYSASPEHKVFSMSHVGYFVKWGNEMYAEGGPMGCYGAQNFDCNDIPNDVAYGGFTNVPPGAKVAKLMANPYFSRDMEPLLNFISKHSIIAEETKQ